MSPSDRRDAVPLILLASVIAALLLASAASRWAHALLALAGRPATVSLVGALLTFALAALVARLVVTRRALARRSAVLAVPADSFDPGEKAVAAFASALGRTRRAVGGFLDAPASAVRVRLDADEEGRLRYLIELPEHARPALRVALAAYDGVELLPAPPPAPEVEDTEVARAELVLARPSSEPLRDARLDPDPLSGFARALESIDPEAGERAAVCVDLLPAAPGRRRRLRRRLLREARRTRRFAPTPGEALAGLLGEGGGPGGEPTPAEQMERRTGRQALAAKVGSSEPLFELQVLVRVASPVPGRAKARLAAILAAFDAFAGENHLRASGLRVPGLAFLGSDLPGRRARFDRRLATGLFRPARRRIVTASEIAGLLKPPTRRCAAANVLRAGAAVGPPPRRLPTFSGQPGLLPLGRVAGEFGERLVGVPLRDTFFFYMSGRSRFGKTETAIGQFLHLARTGHGCLFLDPHHDAIARIKAHLTDEGLRDRVVEIDLTAAERQPAWNLLATAGRSPLRAAGQVDAVVDAFASALRWDEVNARALNLTTQSVRALADLARRLPAELAPTIFQIPALLGDEEWRAAVLPHVSAPVREFFAERFPRLAPEAITPVTNLIDRLRASAPAAALLGSPLASYDVRAAMDRGLVVLVCPGPGSGRDRLIANLVVFDALHAARSRAELAPAARRPFHLWLDEVQIYDGATSGTLAALLEQAGKFGVRALLFNQNPERLTAATRDAVMTNRSHLATTALNAKGAALLARELGGGIDAEAISRLPRFGNVASVTLDGEVSLPFRLAGVPVEELPPGRLPPAGRAAPGRRDRPPRGARPGRRDPRSPRPPLAGHRRAPWSRAAPRPPRRSQGGRRRLGVSPALPRLGTTGVEVLESISQHRLLSTLQIRALHAPRASLRWTQELTARLRALGLAAAVSLPGGLGLWYLTEEGALALAAVPSRAEARARAIRPEQAAGPLQEHTIAVNDVGIAFVRAARERGDECGPFDWFHEVAHSLGPPPGRRMPEQLIADAVLTYQLAEADGTTSVLYRFVELDRANRSAADLARRLGRYARLYRRTVPADRAGSGSVALWQRLYPVFPVVLLVLAGRSRDRLEERRRVVLALCSQDPDLAGTPEVEVSACLLEDVVECGPFAAICRTPAGPDRDVDWLGEEGE